MIKKRIKNYGIRGQMLGQSVKHMYRRDDKKLAFEDMERTRKFPRKIHKKIIEKKKVKMQEGSTCNNSTLDFPVNLHPKISAIVFETS